MLRFYTVIITHLFSCIRFIFGLKKIIKHKERYSEKEKYNYCRKIVHKVSKASKVTVNVYGTENLPKEPGYVMYSNHQGRYDGLAIIDSHEEPCTVVLNAHRGKALFIRQFLEVLGAKKIVVGDLRGTAKLFREVEEEIKAGRNYIMFPEGIFYDNRNTMIDFHTGCMHFVFHTKCPIVPVTLYDTYKVYGVNSLKRVSCEVHYLKPIPYEEYHGLDKNELASLVKSKIQEKLDELNASHQNNI